MIGVIKGDVDDSESSTSPLIYFSGPIVPGLGLPLVF
jgi:hypothetical protein